MGRDCWPKSEKKENVRFTLVLTLENRKLEEE